MNLKVEVCYEGGVLKPTQPLPWLHEHQRFTIDVPGDPPPFPFRDWVLSPPLDSKIIDEMEIAIEEEFGKVDEDNAPSW